MVRGGRNLNPAAPARKRRRPPPCSGGRPPASFGRPQTDATRSKIDQRMYRAPDFSQPRFADAPEARFEPAPADGVLPEGFFSTTNLPTYVKVPGGAWMLPRDP